MMHVYVGWNFFMAQEICDGCIVVKVDVDAKANVHVCCVANIFLHLETLFKFDQVEKKGEKRWKKGK